MYFIEKGHTIFNLMRFWWRRSPQHYGFDRFTREQLTLHCGAFHCQKASSFVCCPS